MGGTAFKTLTERLEEAEAEKEKLKEEKEQAEAAKEREKAENERLRKILEEHGLSDLE